MIPKVIIDCDAGTDDAMAIFMLLEAHRKEHIEVLAITTVNGNTIVDNVNKNVIAILTTTNQLQIPVFSGAKQALVVPFKFPEYPYHGEDGFGDAFIKLPNIMQKNEKNIEEENASLAILRLIQENKNEVILAALGPLTNIALCLNLNQKAFTNLKDFYIMGGNLNGVGNITAVSEFNFHADPEAAKIVLDRCPFSIKVVVWETCSFSINISLQERLDLGKMGTVSANILNVIEENSLIAKEKTLRPYITCDQFIAAWLLDDHVSEDHNLVEKTQDYQATVELQGFHTRGMMVIERRTWHCNYRKANIIVLEKVNKEVYMKYLAMAFL